jgi:hypothetical protein
LNVDEDGGQDQSVGSGEREVWAGYGSLEVLEGACEVVELLSCEAFGGLRKGMGEVERGGGEEGVAEVGVLCWRRTCFSDYFFNH